MPAQWTADLIGEMHLHNVTKRQLAAAAGLTPEYISMVLNGHRDPKGAEATLREALARIIAHRDKDNTETVP